MAKGKQPKCRWCNNLVDKDLGFEKTSVGYYHVECYQLFSTNKQHQKELSDYIIQIYRIDFPTGWMLKQIKQYKEERKYTYKGMELTLRFIHEVEQKYVKEASDVGLGLIPYYYEKAKKYYMNLASVTSSASSVEINNVTEVVYIDEPKPKTRKRKHIDMSSIV